MKINEDIKKIIMYSTSWCSDCFRTRAFFSRYSIEYVEIDIEENPETAEIVEKINNGDRSVPTIIVEMKDGSKKILVEPNIIELESNFLV